MDTVVEMHGIDKFFNNIKVNDQVDFALRKGEIHCLLGENGAGKTTLMNILYGLYTMEAGNITMAGKAVTIKNPLHAIEHGIGMVHQHFKLVDTLSVYENIILGCEETKNGFLVRRESMQKISKIAADCGFAFDLDAKVSGLPIGVKQRVEIIKALYKGAHVLILDEPTSVLTPQEVDEIFVTLNKLKAQGTSIVFITHKMRETFEVSDTVTVMRRGKIVATVKTSETSSEELANMMVGRSITAPKLPARQRAENETPILSVNELFYSAKEGADLHGINLDIYPGEIVGIAGVDGNGQAQLVELLAGIHSPTSGAIMLDGKDISSLTPRKIIDRGLALIPDDRHKLGLVNNFDMTHNLLLGKQWRGDASRGGLVKWKHLGLKADVLIREYDISPPEKALPLKNFSGGNQQKVIIARELSSENLRLVVAFQPTRGLDIGAIEFVQKQLLRMRNEGKAILLISAELDEVRTMSDRIAVIFEGRLLDTRPAAAFSEQELGLLMAGEVKERQPA